MASGSPARTPRRGRAASTEDKQEKEKSTTPELPPTIPEETNDKSKDEEIVTSTNDEKVTEESKELEQPQEVKKKPGRARKIDQLKPDITEDVPTPSKRSRRGVTPVQPVKGKLYTNNGETKYLITNNIFCLLLN